MATPDPPTSADQRTVPTASANPASAAAPEHHTVGGSYEVPHWAKKFLAGFGLMAALPLALWALAAGTWRALDSAAANTAMGNLVGYPQIAAVGAVPFYFLGAFAAAFMILVAAGLIGGAFGFLFGLPRMEPRSAGSVAEPRRSSPGSADGRGAEAGGAVAVAAGDGTAVAVAPAPAGRTGFRMSPALNEIADWLTKIIVGVGLIQARGIGEGFVDVMHFLLQDAGLVRYPAAGVVVPACMITGLIGGFILCYLVMTLLIGPQLARAADDLETVSELRERAEQAKRNADEEKRRRAEAEAETARTEARARERARVVDDWRKFDLLELLSPRPGGVKPKVSAAAREFADVDFALCATLDEKLAWAKINAALGRQDRASDAYETLQEPA